MSIDVDPDLLGKGVKDALSCGNVLLTEEEVRAAVTQLQAESRRKVQAKRAGLADKEETERPAK